MKKSTAIMRLNRIAIVLILGTLLTVVANNVCRLMLIDVTDRHFNLTWHANRFREASTYLTNEVRAYAATGDPAHYSKYWNEVQSAKNREVSVARLKEIGLTPDEEAMIERMSALSDGLVPLEIEALELAAAGDQPAALALVYSPDYNTTIAQITALRDRFADELNQRTSAEVKRMEQSYNVVNLFTWLMMAATILIQILQKRGLFQLAYVDELTGEDNYTAFREKMRTGSGVSGRGYVVSADLRGFSTINDTCGIAKGDEVIGEMGRVLSKGLMHGELAAHISGDCFVLFLHSEGREALVERITAFREEIVDLSPVLDVPHMVPVFGIREVESPAHPERSYGDANLAKQRMPRRAGVFYAFFDKKVQRVAIEQQKLEDGFETALRERRFEMWYQPKYEPQNGRIVAAEALVRWREPDGSLIPPGKFIPLFEGNGMIARLDEYTFDSVCAQQRACLDEGREVVPISINVSRASLLYSDIVARYMVIANRHGVSTDMLELEITESAIDSTENIDELIRQFRSAGFRILVDDFGSGYSSLSTLTKNYFDNIKIDKSLVDCIGTAEGDSLLASIIRLAHEFHMTVTAEGVEDDKQVAFLRGLSCDNIQGYYYAKPLPHAEFHALLAGEKRPV